MPLKCRVQALGPEDLCEYHTLKAWRAPTLQILSAGVVGAHTHNLL